MMLLKQSVFKCLGAALIVFIACTGTVFAESAKRVLIIANAGGEPYAQTIEGFKQELSEKSSATFTDLLVNNVREVSQEIKNNPDLIFTLGADSTELALQNTTSIPIVATLILKNDMFKASNITGVSLAYPMAMQIQWLKKFFPVQKKVAILFNPAENATVVQAIKPIAAQSGFEIIPIPVNTPKQLPDALEQLAQNVEVLLSIPDDVTMSPKTAKEVLLASFRNKVPMVGLSDNWVKSGALYALTWDYDDLGRQSAELAEKLLNGQPIQKMTTQSPRKMVYTINAKIAEHMNVDISESLLKNAQTIIQ